MKTISTTLLAGLIGGVVGGVIVWIARDREVAPPVVIVEQPLAATAAAESRQAAPGAPVVRHVRLLPGVTRAAEETTTISHARTAAPDIAAARPRPITLIENPAPEPVRTTLNQNVSVQQANFSANASGFALLTLPPLKEGVADDSVTQAIIEALSFAHAASAPYVQEGYTRREEFWGGELAPRKSTTLVHQLFKGNEYWFWLGSPVQGAKIFVHVYDRQGNFAEAESWQQPHAAAARVTPKGTGAYRVHVGVESSPEAQTPWALAYGYR